MNVNELSSSLYGYQIGNMSLNQNSNKIVHAEAVKTASGQSFSDILSEYAINGDSDSLDVDTLKNELLESTEETNNSSNTSDVMNILTDAEKAKEYLSSKSGMSLITSMIENNIASIISGNEN